MTTTELLSLLQFNHRWTLRTLPSGLSTVADRQHLLGLYAGIEAGEEATAYVRGCTAQAIGPKSVLSVAPIMPQAVGQSQTLSIGACE